LKDIIFSVACFSRSVKFFLNPVRVERMI